jgi:hypothetical protein
MIPITDATTETTEPRALGWYPDPFGRHERRFHDGRRWTDHVADGDVLAREASIPGRGEHERAPRRGHDRRASRVVWIASAAAIAILVVALLVRWASDDDDEGSDAPGGAEQASAITTPDGGGSEDAPLPLGSAVTVGEWRVAVLAVDDHGAALVAGAGGPAPADGSDFVVVHLRVENIGTEPGSVLDSATVGFRGADGRTYDDALGAVVPSALAGTPPVAPGADAVGTVVLEVPTTAIEGGKVFVESSLSLESERAWWR